MGEYMNKKYVDEIIKLSKKAYKLGEIPVGCIIVKNNEIIAKGYNSREKNKSIICHAEINAIKKAEKVICDWRLYDCDLYTTLFPCPMCASAIQQSRIRNIYYILPCNNRSLFVLSKKILNNKKSNHIVKINKIRNNNFSLDFFFKIIRNK